MKKIVPYLIALVAGASSLTSCATVSVGDVVKSSRDPVGYAMKVLEIDDPRMLNSNLPDGYFSSRLDGMRLQRLAGIYAGTVQAISTKNGYLFDGYYSQFKNPEAMQKVLKDADMNRDHVVTSREVQDLTRKVEAEFLK